MNNNMKYKHSHPINILEHTSKYLLLLIFPIIRALINTTNSLYVWLKGAWFDIMTIMIILLLGFIAWYQYVYSLSPAGIYLKRGIFIVKRRFISYKKLSVVSIEKPFYLVPFHAVRITADTDGGSPKNPDFQITVYASEVDEIIKLSKTPFVNQSELKKVYLPKNFYIAILSFVASNSLTGVLFVSTFISGTGKVLGEEFEKLMVSQLTEIANFLAFGIPPFAATIAFTILGGWLVSFILNLIRHLKFSVTRQSGNLHIKSGLVTKREYLITVQRINFIDLRQTLFTKLFGFYTAFIHSNGYGKQKDELSVLMPSGESHDLSQNLEMLLPEIPICKPILKPKPKYLSRFIIPPINFIIAVSALWFITYEFFPEFNDIIGYVGIMAEIPCFWYLAVKILSYFHTGIGTSENAYTLCYTYGYRIKTVAVPKKRIVKLIIRRSFFQLMSGSCDLIVFTLSEGMKRHVVPNLNFEEVQKIMDVEEIYPKREGLFQ